MPADVDRLGIKHGLDFVVRKFGIGRCFGAMAAAARLGEQIDLWIQLHTMAAYLGDRRFRGIEWCERQLLLDQGAQRSDRAFGVDDIG